MGRIQIFWGLYWTPPILADYHVVSVPDEWAGSVLASALVFKANVSLAEATVKDLRFNKRSS